MLYLPRVALREVVALGRRGREHARVIVPRHLTAARLVVVLELALIRSRVLTEGRSDRIVPAQHSKHALAREANLSKEGLP